jgi:hypothetical protein
VGEMVTVAFSDDIVNASELRNRQKYWLERASSKPVTVTCGTCKLAIIDRDEVSNLYLYKHYMDMTIKYCEEVLNNEKSSIFPWLDYLDNEEKEAFHGDLITGIARASVTGNWTDVDDLIEDWQATTEAKQDREFVKTLKVKVPRKEYLPID